MSTQQKTTREKVTEMRRAGLNARQIALVLGVTTQAVYKHLKALDDGDKEGAA